MILLLLGLGVAATWAVLLGWLLWPWLPLFGLGGVALAAWGVARLEERYARENEAAARRRRL